MDSKVAAATWAGIGPECTRPTTKTPGEGGGGEQGSTSASG